MTSADNVQALVGKSLRNRIMVTYALCAVAESQAHGGEAATTLNTLKAIRGLIGEINILMSEPNGRISASTIREAGELATELEARTQAIEAAIGSKAPSYH